jgi:hypothetical protein
MAERHVAGHADQLNHVICPVPTSCIAATIFSPPSVTNPRSTSLL